MKQKKFVNINELRTILSAHFKLDVFLITDIVVGDFKTFLKPGSICTIGFEYETKEKTHLKCKDCMYWKKKLWGCGVKCWEPICCFEPEVITKDGDEFCSHWKKKEM